MSAHVRGAQPQVSRDLPDVPRDSLGHVRLYAVPRRGQPSSCPPPQPLLMKVMACLRRMAFGISFDGLEDVCGISKSRTLHFFALFGSSGSSSIIITTSGSDFQTTWPTRLWSCSVIAASWLHEQHGPRPRSLRSLPCRSAPSSAHRQGGLPYHGISSVSHWS